MTFQANALPPAIDLKQDSHVHTRLCNHASGEMEEYVLAAIRMGLESLTFLEHLEADIQYFERTWLTEDDFSYYFSEGERLRTKYRDQIRILLGVEVGYNPEAVELLNKQIAEHTWDRIGLSYHFLFDGNTHLNMVSRRQNNIEALGKIGASNVITRYLDGLIQGVKKLDCHFICHLDAVMRHDRGIQFHPSHWDQVKDLLHLMRDKGMQLELNTSGFTLRNTPYPCHRIVSMAIELGIPLLAGSDAHRPEQVGRDFDRLTEFLSG